MSLSLVMARATVSSPFRRRSKSSSLNVTVRGVLLPDAFSRGDLRRACDTFSIAWTVGGSFCASSLTVSLLATRRGDSRSFTCVVSISLLHVSVCFLILLMSFESNSKKLPRPLAQWLLGRVWLGQDCLQRTLTASAPLLSLVGPCAAYHTEARVSETVPCVPG